ncbi:ABC transporter ATP-binding protein [Bdellovibrio sp. ZAP7]|uniref:ABC transporter ATP-binding protein n=1 Tax=Bdellovibrio sp. ZAP7 TaxID=2231053 RepID=UPI001FED670D|nr:ABC transporter ATP-binding protein [Bdellovibrio sp. ZAP7]
MGEVRVQALQGVNVSFSPGEFVVLLGPSGSGKSTLLNILGGLDIPTSGSVVFQKQTLTAVSPEELTEFRRKYVGFIFQFYNLIPNLTALENIKLVTEIAEEPMEPEAALKLVGLEGRQYFFPSQLSGGEQQRVAIARAIAKKPKVLLCDEPTGALDLQTGKMVLSAIQKVHHELGTLVIIITHNSAIAGLADRILFMGDGKIVREENNTKKISIEEVFW